VPHDRDGQRSRHPPEVREKLFTPFFTTKARGTGLGLSTAKRFVEAQGGTIAIDCPPTGGTTVSIELPRFEGALPGGPILETVGLHGTQLEL
jgi:nitrogen-specific signal transduction histidine kinase